MEAALRPNINLNLNLLFIAALTIAWAWFNAAPASRLGPYNLEHQTDLSGWRFEPIQLMDLAKKILATTNILNGHYYGSKEDRVAVFVGNWDHGSTESLAVVEHTPDICWVGIGWKPISVGNPSQAVVMLSGKPIPFQLRIFNPPTGGPPELTIWCTTINNQLYDVNARSQSTGQEQNDTRLQIAQAGRNLGLTFLTDSLVYRIPAKAKKKFIRISVEIKNDWKEALDRAVKFAQIWITLDDHKAY